MSGHLHNYSVPVEGEPHSRCCEICGVRQVFRPPTGKGTPFPDVLVDRGDLSVLLSYAEDIFSEQGVDYMSDPLLIRVRDLLD